MKKLFIIFGITVCALVSILICKDLIIKSAVVSAVSRMTGARVHIDSFSLNVLNSTIHISGLRIYNPKGFPDGVLLFCSRIDVIYDPATLLKEKRHLLVVDIELSEMVLTRNLEGKLNVDSLSVAQPHSPPVSVQIDLVTLGIGKIVYKDYRKNTEPDVRVNNVNRHKSYKGIPTVQQLVALVMAEPIKAAGIKSAQIYGVVMVAGVAVMPVAVVATFIGPTSVKQIIDVHFEQAYEVSLAVLKRMGSVTRQDLSKGMIQANIKGANVTLQLTRKGPSAELTISARKYLFPKLDIAGGVLYEISEKL